MTTSKIISVIVSIVVLCALAVLGILRLASGPEDLWVCIDGQWQAHGQTAGAPPAEGCELARATSTPAVETLPVKITIYSDRLKVDWENGLVSGLGLDESEATATWQAIVATSTKLYRQISSTTQEEFSLAELAERLKNWAGPRWPVFFLGEKIGTSTLMAREIYYLIQ